MMEFTNDVKWILGRPNFWCGPIAHQLVRLGLAEIPPSSEDEQAFVLHWLLGLHAAYGPKFREAADKILTGGLGPESSSAPTFLQDIEQRVASGEISHEEALVMVDQQALIDATSNSGEGKS